MTKGWLFAADHDNHEHFRSITMDSSKRHIWAYAGGDQMHGAWLRRYDLSSQFTEVHLQGGDSGDWPQGDVLAVDQHGNFWMDGVYLQ